MADVIKIKIMVLLGFVGQLIYLTWFAATTLGEIRQDLHLIKYRLERLEHP